MSKHVALVGFMAAGKSMIGKAVAARLNCPLTDTDDEVERIHGPIAEIFARQGEAAFREYELDAVARAVASKAPRVISVGGGALTHPHARTLLEKHALRVFLAVSAPTILRRIERSAEVRPMLGAEPTLESVERLYERRLPLYRECDITVDCDGLSVDEAAKAICDALHAAGAA